MTVAHPLSPPASLVRARRAGVVLRPCCTKSLLFTSRLSLYKKPSVGLREYQQKGHRKTHGNRRFYASNFAYLTSPPQKAPMPLKAPSIDSTSLRWIALPTPSTELLNRFGYFINDLGGVIFTQPDQGFTLSDPPFRLTPEAIA